MSCSSSGRQLEWLRYEEDSRWLLASTTTTAALGSAYPQLREERFLTTKDLTPFTVEAVEEVKGATQGSARKLTTQLIDSLDPECERVVQQQYVRALLVRREAHFEMCYQAGKLLLLGNELVTSVTPEALRPISRRNSLWIGAMAGALILSQLLVAAAKGTGEYFEVTNSRVEALRWAGLFLLTPTVGALLRSLRPGARFWPLTLSEKFAAISAPILLLLVPLVSLVSRPTPEQVHTELARGNIKGARTVVEALQQRLPATQLIEELDAVDLGEVESSTFERRLKLLDAVAARGGSHASEAASSAYNRRIEAVNRQIEAKAPDAALALLDQWFARGTIDSTVAETRAKSLDAKFEACAEVLCRFLAARDALGVSMSPARSQRLDASNQELLSQLVVADIPTEALLDRVKRLHAKRHLAIQVLSSISYDEQIVTRARLATELAEKFLAAMPLLGSEPTVVRELLGGTLAGLSGTPCLLVGTLRVCLSLDAANRTRGVYVTGHAAGSRPVKDAEWPSDRILSQAIGHTATVPTLKAPTLLASQSVAHGVPVIARWHRGELWELRIGNAAP